MEREKNELDENKDAGLAERTGAPLPGTLQSRFEASLGQSLGDVRIHRDEQAATDARGMNAKAYTVGRDIFFSAGRFDPDSTGGQKLLAHEVAHAAQQQMAPVGPQLKPEVQEGGDALEHEADRAAAAMLRGAPFRLSRAEAPRIAKKGEDVVELEQDTVYGADVAFTEDHISADPAKAMDKAADEAQGKMAKDRAYTVAGAMDTVNDQEAAKALVKKIEQHMHECQVIQGDGTQHSDVSLPADSNIAAMGALEDYIGQSEVQGFSLKQFNPLYQTTMEDFARLQSATTVFESENPSKGKGMTPTQAQQRGGDVGGAMIHTAGVGSDKKIVDAIGTEDKEGPAREKMVAAKQASENLATESAEADGVRHQVLGAYQSAAAKATQMSIGARMKTDADPDKENALKIVQDSINNTKNVWKGVKTAIDVATSAGLKAATIPAGVTKVTDKVGEFVSLDTAVTAAIDAYHASALNTATIAVNNSAKLNDLKSVAQTAKDAAGAPDSLKGLVSQLNAKMQKIANLRQRVEQSTSALGKKYDEISGKGGHPYEQLAKILSECTRFVEQAKMARKAGEAEKDKGNATKGKRDGLKDSRGRGIPWFSVRAQNKVESDAGLADKRVLERNTVNFTDYEGKNKTKEGGVGGSAFGEQGANDLVDDAMKQLDTVIGNAEKIKARLEALFFEGKA